jgi:hypothetical protein
MINKKSQTAIEFLIITGFVLILFTILFLSIQGSTGSKIVERNTIAVKEVAYTIQDEINLAAGSTDGYKRTFRLPAKINGMDYDIILINDGSTGPYDYIQIATTNGKYSMGVGIETIVYGSKIKKGQNNTVVKENGNVKVDSP